MPVKTKTAGRARPASVNSPKLVSTSDPKFRVRFEKARRQWRVKVRPLVEGARASERISERDLAIRINARG